MRIIHALRPLLDVLLPRTRAQLLVGNLPPRLLERTCVATWVRLAPDVLAPLPYDHVLVHTAILEAKYHNSESAARLLGSALGPFLSEDIAERQQFGSFVSPLVVPIPLHTKRERNRGYNQAARIAQALIRAVHLQSQAFCPGALTRVRDTTSQVRQRSRDERISNLAGAFRADTRLVRGKDIIVVDDVVTTGATLHAAHEALMRGGAREVLLVACAH